MSRLSFQSQTNATLLIHKSAILCLSLTLPLSAIYFIAIRTHNVELSFDQLSAFERQVQTVGNNTVYIIEPPTRDPIFSSLAHEDWAKVASRVDYVAFLYDDIDSMIATTNCISEASQTLSRMQPPGYGVVLFSCGCIVPNLVFTNTQIRFDGFECMMLPGFVMDKEYVRFIDVRLPGQGCKNREAVLGAPWYETNAWKLEDARGEHQMLRAKLLADHYGSSYIG